MLNITKIKQNGETIIEVLIAVMVLSSALAGAYAIAGRSQKSIQANQERYQAQLLANAQADMLKAYYPEHESDFTTTSQPSNFCMYLDNSDNKLINNINPPTVYNNKCLSSPNDGVEYKINLVNLNPGTYSIEIDWDGLVTGDSKLRMIYAIF